LSEEDATYFSLADSDPPGKGREEMDAIWHALVSGTLEPVFRVLREIGAAGNLFRCRSFHIGILSGKKKNKTHQFLSSSTILFLCHNRFSVILTIKHGVF
jgi:hypothetical protein